MYLQLPPLGIALVRRAIIEHGRPVDFELCIYVDDTDATAAALEAQGGQILVPPQDRPWGERNAIVETLDGHLLHVAQKLGSYPVSRR